MADTASLTIAMSPELLASLQRYAETHQRTLQDTAEEALRMFVDDEDMTDIRRYHALRAEMMGLSLEEYVVAMVKEHRRDARKQHAA